MLFYSSEIQLDTCSKNLPEIPEKEFLPGWAVLSEQDIFVGSQIRLSGQMDRIQLKTINGY